MTTVIADGFADADTRWSRAAAVPESIVEAFLHDAVKTDLQRMRDTHWQPVIFRCDFRTRRIFVLIDRHAQGRFQRHIFDLRHYQPGRKLSQLRQDLTCNMRGARSTSVTSDALSNVILDRMGASKDPPSLRISRLSS